MRELSTERLINYLILQYDSKNIKEAGLEGSYQRTLLHAKNLATEYIQQKIGADLDYNGGVAILKFRDGYTLKSEVNLALSSLSNALEIGVITDKGVNDFIHEKHSKHVLLHCLNTYLLPSLGFAIFSVTAVCFIVSAVKACMNFSSLSNFSISNPLVILPLGVSLVKMCTGSIYLLEEAEKRNNNELRVGLNLNIHRILSTSFAETELAKKLGKFAQTL